MLRKDKRGEKWVGYVLTFNVANKNKERCTKQRNIVNEGAAYPTKKPANAKVHSSGLIGWAKLRVITTCNNEMHTWLCC